MKRILIVCLIGMGLLLPSTNLTAKNFSINHSGKVSSKRVVNCLLEGEALFITSDAETGTLVWAKIYDEGKTLQLQDYVTGYSDDMDVSSLANGNYSVTVHTTMGNYYRYFTIS